MGRGPRQQATMTAKGLLFGPRRAGSGPTQSAEPVITEVHSRDQGCAAIADACLRVGMISDHDHVQAQLIKEGFFIVDSEQGHYSINLRDERSGVYGVSIESVSDNSPSVFPERVASPGRGDTLRGAKHLEQLLHDPLQEAGFTYVDVVIDGQEAFRRLGGGEKIDFSTPAWDESDIHARRRVASQEVRGLRDTGIIDYDDLDLLNRIIDYSQSDNILAELAGDAGAHNILASAPCLPVRITF